MNLQLSRKRKLQLLSSVKEKEEYILDTFKTFQEQYPGCIRRQLVQFTANRTGFCVADVKSVLRLPYVEQILKVRMDKLGKTTASILNDFDYETKSSIRRIVSSFCREDENPKLENILLVINKQNNFPALDESTLKELLTELGFRYGTKEQTCVLHETNEMVEMRMNYLRKLRKLKNERKKIYFLDETWVNVGTIDQTVVQAVSPVDYIASDDTIKTNRLVVLHIGSEDGFVTDGLLLFGSQKTEVYKEDVSAEVFEKWFQRILPKLEEGAGIVLDSAAYHSRVDGVPNSVTSKTNIHSWLHSQSIPFEESMIKPELLDLVKKHTSKKTYVVDELAKAHNRIVLRLPPYHAELNPLEIIWAQVEKEVVSKNTTFKIQDVGYLLHTAVSNVSPENWKTAIEHTDRMGQDMWQQDVIEGNEEYINSTSLSD